MKAEGSMTYERIVFGKEGELASITLNRPEKLNAYDTKMETELADALRKVQSDDDVKVLILTGAGRGFCTGHDLIEASQDQEAGRRVPSDVPRLAHYPPLLLRDVDKPIIAAINGVAAGGGFALALMCDIRIASEEASFVEGHVNLGTTPAVEAWLLPRIVGLERALELILSGRRISAEDARSIGLVSQVVPARELMATARELGKRIARGPMQALVLSKRAVYKGLDSDLSSTLEYVASARALCHQSSEFKNRVSSFAKRT